MVDTYGFDSVAGLKRVHLENWGQAADWFVTPDNPATNVLTVDGQFDGHYETAVSTKYEKATESGSDRLKVSYFEPRLNGAEDNSSEDHLIAINLDGTVQRRTFRWDNSTNAAAYFTYNGDGNVTEYDDYREQPWTFGYTTVNGLNSMSVSMMSSVTDPTSKITSWTYDDDNGTTTPWRAPSHRDRIRLGSPTAESDSGNRFEKSLRSNVSKRGMPSLLIIVPAK